MLAHTDKKPPAASRSQGVTTRQPENARFGGRPLACGPTGFSTVSERLTTRRDDLRGRGGQFFLLARRSCLLVPWPLLTSFLLWIRRAASIAS